MPSRTLASWLWPWSGGSSRGPGRSRVLVATNHLEELSGSETVSLEVAEYFRSSHAAAVTVFANWAAPPMSDLFAAGGMTIETDPQVVRPFEYDVAWLQHGVAAQFDYRMTPEAVRSTNFIFSHLSPFSELESVGLFLEDILASRIVANSDETAAHLATLGVALRKLHVFHNACPRPFFDAPRRKPRDLSKILVVSNHAPHDLRAAMKLLGERLQVTHIGRHGGRIEPVTAQLIQAHDMVVTIGKTVQYGLACGVPVYVYDKFGGPGYLNRTNFAAAKRCNFSGRCCRRKLEPAQIGAEIVEAYNDARAFVDGLSADDLDCFRLERQMDEILRAADLRSNASLLRQLERNRILVQRERIVSRALRRYYRVWRR
jgi:hypothetical protein